MRELIGGQRDAVDVADDVPQLHVLVIQQHYDPRGLRVEGAGHVSKGVGDEFGDAGVRNGGLVGERVDAAPRLGCFQEGGGAGHLGCGGEGTEGRREGGGSGALRDERNGNGNGVGDLCVWVRAGASEKDSCHVVLCM